MLSYEEIIENINYGNIFIDPFNETHLGANSYDLCLGNWFIELLGYNGGKPYYGEFFYLEDGQKVMIRQTGLLLGMTKERAGSKNNLVPVLKTRSTIMRMGIDLCKSAGLGDVGYFDQHWTIEITSHIPLDSPEPACLEVGSRVAQIYFDRCLRTDHQYTGQYQAGDWPLCMLPKEFRKDYQDLKRRKV